MRIRVPGHQQQLNCSQQTVLAASSVGRELRRGQIVLGRVRQFPGGDVALGRGHQLGGQFVIGSLGGGHSMAQRCRCRDDAGDGQVKLALPGR